MASRLRRERGLSQVVFVALACGRRESLRILETSRFSLAMTNHRAKADADSAAEGWANQKIAAFFSLSCDEDSIFQRRHDRERLRGNFHR